MLLPLGRRMLFVSELGLLHDLAGRRCPAVLLWIMSGCTPAAGTVNHSLVEGVLASPQGSGWLLLCSHHQWLQLAQPAQYVLTEVAYAAALDATLPHMSLLGLPYFSSLLLNSATQVW